MGITMGELAKLANVSQGAVSLVLNGKAQGQISPQKQELIRSLAQKHNYRVNMAAKILRKKKQYAVGIIMPDSLNLFYASLITLFQEIFSEQGYVTLFSFFRSETFENVYAQLRDRQVDGLISWETSPLMLEEKIPTVLFRQDINEVPSPFSPQKHLCRCGFDFTRIYPGLFQYLYDLGHRKIGFIGHTSDPRCQLLAEFLDQKGLALPSKWLFHHLDDLNGSNAFFDSILTMADRPTALITTNDETARQMISAGHRLGIRFPEDLSITGFMNLPYTGSMYPALTTLDCRNRQLAEEMAKMLLTLIEQPDQPVEDIFIQPELILRESCGQPK